MHDLFLKIMAHEIPAKFEYEDEQCIAIHDIHPKAPVHLLIIPRKPIPSIADLTPEDQPLIGHLIYVAKDLAERFECEGYQLKFHVREKGGQEIMHLHLHLLGWPAE